LKINKLRRILKSFIFIIIIIIIFLLSKQTVTNESHKSKKKAHQEGKKGIAHTKSNLPTNKR
jgi:uncharacterized protein YpmB